MNTVWPTFTETEQHREVRDAVRAVLGSWRPFLIAVDGVDAAGKSNFARYLGWQLGMPAIETDLFLDGNRGGLNYRLDQLNSAIQARLSRGRPVILEGVRVLHLLQHLDLAHDYLVWVEQKEHEGSHSLSTDLAAYQREFTPRSRANSIFIRPPDDLGARAV